MSLQYIIDGYNIINHPLFSRSPKQGKDCRIDLLHFISSKRLCGSPKNKVTIVFDGFSPVSRDFDLNYAAEGFIFSHESSADDVIKDLVESSKQPKNIIVVSDDKDIRISVKFSGASVLGVEEFITSKERSEASKKGHFSSSEAKPELNRIEIFKINQELERKWLK
jgi:predicted RNA-binding protein with PIN domain